MLYFCYYFNFFFHPRLFQVRMCVPYVPVATPIISLLNNTMLAKLSFDTPRNVLD